MFEKKVLMPLPSYGFDPTEVAIPYKILSENGVNVLFATPNGQKANTDELMLTGIRLGIWKRILMARQDAVDAYNNLSHTENFCHPLSYQAINVADFDGIILAGGHDKGMREYLESTILQNAVVNFFEANKPVGAICHGVILVARSKNPSTQKSVINGYKTTALLKTQEKIAYRLTQLWLKDYYLTYPQTTVEDEVKMALAQSSDFLEGNMPIVRDSEKNRLGFTVKDKNYLSARWPGDAYTFAYEFLKMIQL